MLRIEQEQSIKKNESESDPGYGTGTYWRNKIVVKKMKRNKLSFTQLDAQHMRHHPLT